jgi:hypothetical protein
LSGVAISDEGDVGVPRIGRPVVLEINQEILPVARKVPAQLAAQGHSTESGVGGVVVVVGVGGVVGDGDVLDGGGAAAVNRLGASQIGASQIPQEVAIFLNATTSRFLRRNPAVGTF